MLFRLLIREESIGKLKGIKIGCAASSVSHILFADNLLLFAKDTIREASKLDECLGKYMAWSG